MTRSSRSALPAILVCLLVPFAHLGGQTPSMAQDPALDNLRHPPGTSTTPEGTFGKVDKVGDGPRSMILIPGLGFGGGIWAEFMARHRTDYTMYAVTLPGFGETAPLPMPPGEARFADLAWTRSAVTAVEELLDRARISRVTLVAHWALGSQIALRLALDHPDRVQAVVLVGGVLKSYYEGTPDMRTWTPAERIGFAEGMGHRWFKTVTRRTWDDNNFMSYDYAVNPRRGLFLWREAQQPSLPVWIRYLLEFYTIDQTAELERLRVPTLVVQPGWDDPAVYVESGRHYMRNLTIDSWQGAAARSSRLEFVTIPRSRLFIMHDQPEALDQAMARFLTPLGRQPD